MADKFAVIGLGQFGSAIAKKLAEKGAEILAIDFDPEKVESIRDYVTYGVTLDATSRPALESQNIADMDAVVVSIGQNFECTMLTVVQLQSLGVKRLMARAQGETQRRILTKLGVEEILSPEEEVGKNVAERLLTPGMLMAVQLPDNYEIVEVEAPKSTVGRSLEDIGLTKKYKLSLITLLRKSNGDHHILGVPEDDTVVEPNDLMVVFGTTKDVERFIHINA
ncbi:MAG: TrkA family potassium uptake protein [Schleiferiaceae bacterium]|jgi:trk system potassium uptake protein|nr:TrkA family potassium uptake protein [Schleiferiaceae bacterium]MDP4626599.1 TrkA family potassium uptake protein [Schleiferiaceae bacterium]MDP4728259.1 TrkA family potassium uptake protein [Schleiferiaceae bacterium]MDP4749449.1 TrkA family potassium uptake protein [Schleiferiaceae bacterium]MDP4859962.1 TrkA family potassium uptake protein [Schleiferiaceae bacterium]